MDCYDILQAKHLQFVSGVHSSSYWLATFAWDLLNALVPIIISIIIFAAFRVEAFSSPEALIAIFVLLVSRKSCFASLVHLVAVMFYDHMHVFTVNACIFIGAHNLGKYSTDIYGILYLL